MMRQDFVVRLLLLIVVDFFLPFLQAAFNILHRQKWHTTKQFASMHSHQD